MTGQRRTRARQIESQSERGKRDGETVCSGECERKERERERITKRKREIKRESKREIGSK